MKILFKLFFFILFTGFVVLPCALIVLGIEKTAWVTDQQPLSFDKVSRVQRLIENNRPAHLKQGQVKKIQINEADLNMVVDYAISQGLATDHVFADIQLKNHHAQIDMTIILPATPMGEYLNLRMTMKSAEKQVSILSLQVGKIRVPGWMVNPVIRFIHSKGMALKAYHEVFESMDAVQSILIQNKTLHMVYEWNPDQIKRLKERSKVIFLPQLHQKKMIHYMNRLQEILSSFEHKAVSLAHVLPAIFSTARLQAAISNDAVSENTAALQALALYANGTDLSGFISQPLQKEIKPRVERRLTLKKRNDLAKHYLISAGLAVSGGSRLANFIGLAKEVDDSDGGSGFSFADLAADRAGVRLAELAVASDDTAAQLQAAMQAVQAENEFMPAIDHLPEGIQTLEFKKRYTDLDTDAYQKVDEEISRRLSQCLVFQ
jgi:hypothetical protein